MYGEAKKLHLIEAILKAEDEVLLKKVEDVLSINIGNTPVRKSFREFAGMLTDDEVKEMEKIIDEGCGQINSDDWK